MKLCAHVTYGPIALTEGQWRVIHRLSREELHLVVYADDETGEIWRFVEDREGQIAKDPAKPDQFMVEKLTLGPGALKLERVDA
jgi:hypothetical protein